jgi:predicted  nucleic acid-binding Zn-ribbon protein
MSERLPTEEEIDTIVKNAKAALDVLEKALGRDEQRLCDLESRVARIEKELSESLGFAP